MACKVNVLESVRADDFVEYYVFPPINSNSDEKTQELTLNQTLVKVEKIVEKYTEEYLWHKDVFKLTVRTWMSNTLIQNDENTEKLPPHLYGVTHFGDNIEDEWFIVFLLQQITREIDGLIVRVYDVDGEFLLIEAADYLPSWADPSTCEKRVYLFQGNIHIVPLEDVENPTAVPITEAIATIRNNPSITFASPEVQNSLTRKLKMYPSNIQSNLHRATAYVPVGVAAILQQKPNLIAPAVQVFCNRDPVDVKACKAMKYFPPENRVNVRVTFTKCLYAMLTHSKYVPDRRTGWNLPKSDSPQFKSHNLGMKIACGFEILAAQAKPSEDLETDKGWNNYLNKLKEKQYFKGLMEHSRDYNDLLNKAKEYYINHRDSMRYTPLIGQDILELSKSLDYKMDDLKKFESNLPEDDDSWLNISPEELDKMLEEKYGQKKFVTINNNTSATTLTDKLSQFLNHVSDLDGVEHPNLMDNSPTRPPRGVKKRTKVSFAQGTKTTENTNNRVSFDPNAFSCAVQNILNFVIPEDDSWDLDSGSDMSDYADENVNEESYEEVKNKMQEYMEQMDKELSKTTIGESFEKKNGDSFDDIETFKPVDIDMNALKNILESYRSQMGEAGPSSNMLGPMGIHLDTCNKQD